MSTTDILFNSPALHSLKRAQLVQLCKRHNIKASGKNVELVARLKEHARGLPSDTPLSVAVRSESFGEGHVATDISDDDHVEEQLTSPDSDHSSQSWEVVSRNGSVRKEVRVSMGSKMDVDISTEHGQATELGATSGSKSTIFKSLASSIGLTRTSSSHSNFASGESSDSLAPSAQKESMTRGSSGSPKSRNLLSSLISRSRSNSHESQTNKKDARKSLITTAIPYNDIPMPSVSRRPQVEPFAFSYAGAEDTSLVSDVSMASIDRPVPGIGPCSSVNAANGAGTIRLITSMSKPSEEDDDAPKLTPVIPAFDLVPPTPGNKNLTRWPVSTTPEANRTLYPVLNSDDRTIDLELLTSPSKSPSKAVDKTLPALPEISPTSPVSPKEPFVFGSPNPRHSTAAADFSNAASTVLAEMNARLGAVGGRAIGTDVLAHAPRSKLAVDDLLKYEFGGARGKRNEGDAAGVRKQGSIGSKFDRMHEKVFSRMDSIDKHYAAKRALKEKEQMRKEDEKLEPLPDNRKRKQSILNKDKTSAPVSTKKKQSMGVSFATKGARKKTASVTIPGAFQDDDMGVEELVTPVDGREDRGAETGDQEDAAEERGLKRACIEEPAADGSGETRRISIVPKVRKDVSEDEKMDEETKRKQNEAIKRRLELNKARRRSSRGGPRTPGQKQKPARGFLASAKSLVKAVWNRGGPSTAPKTKPLSSMAQTTNEHATADSGPSYLKATASSVSKAAELEAKTESATVLKPSVSRTSIIRNTGVRTGGLRPKASTSHPRVVSGSGLDTVVEGKKALVTSPQARNRQASGPVLDISRQHKPPTVVSVTRTNSGSKGLAASSSGSRSSRLLAPTASSLAKATLSPSKGTGMSGMNVVGSPQRPKISSAKARASVISPSKIPVFSPTQRKNLSMASGDSVRRSIFGSALVLPSSQQARTAAEKGNDINPITGAVSPQKRLPFSSANGQTQSLTGAVSEITAKKNTGANERKDQNEPVRSPNGAGVTRKPRISRSKVVAKLGAHRERPTSSPTRPRAPHAISPAKTPSVRAGAVPGGSKGPATPKVRSSTNVAARRSVGGPKVRESGANALIMSAKKRARATEFARRRSAKVPGPDFSKGGEGMDVDE